MQSNAQRGVFKAKTNRPASVAAPAVGGTAVCSSRKSCSAKLVSRRQLRPVKSCLVSAAPSGLSFSRLSRTQEPTKRLWNERGNRRCASVAQISANIRIVFTPQSLEVWDAYGRGDRYCLSPKTTSDKYLVCRKQCSSLQACAASTYALTTIIQPPFDAPDERQKWRNESGV